MTDERALRVAAAARECAADWAILTSPDAVAYAAGHVASIEAGPSPFNGAPTTAIVSADGIVALLCNELEGAAANAAAVSVLSTYESLGYGDLTPLEDKYVLALQDLSKQIGLGGTVAVQQASFPWAASTALASVVDRYVIIDRTLERQRATKTATELDLLRRCAEITAVGQKAALDSSVAGRTELEAFADIRCAMESAAGERLALTGDFLSGIERTAGIMGWPGSRQLQELDPVICDLAPRVNGYWGDSCNTFVLGEASERFTSLRQITRHALEHAASVLRPGITAGELDGEVRAVIERAGLRNPLHIGHGVGTSSHEWPRVVPGSRAVLEPGMVLMLEPGAYEAQAGGARLEWMFHVTPNGNDVLSPFEHVLRAGVPATR